MSPCLLDPNSQNVVISNSESQWMPKLKQSSNCFFPNQSDSNLECLSNRIPQKFSKLISRNRCMPISRIQHIPRSQNRCDSNAQIKSKIHQQTQITSNLHNQSSCITQNQPTFSPYNLPDTNTHNQSKCNSLNQVNPIVKKKNEPISQDEYKQKIRVSTCVRTDTHRNLKVGLRPYSEVSFPHHLRDQSNITLQKRSDCNQQIQFDYPSQNVTSTNSRELFTESNPCYFPSKCAFCSCICTDFFCDTCQALEDCDYSFCEFVIFRMENVTEIEENQNNNHFLPLHKTRKITTRHEKTILEALYQKRPIPSQEDISAIQENIGWDYGRVLKWFDNRRTAEGKKIHSQVPKKKSFLNKRKRKTNMKDRIILDAFFQKHANAHISTSSIRQIQKLLSKRWSRERVVQWISNKKKMQTRKIK